VDLATIVDVSQIVAALTVVGGTLFAVLQVREMKQQRQEAAAMDLLRAFMGPEFADAMATVTGLPDGLTSEGLRRAGPDAEKAATLMCTTFEAMGVLVHRRIAPLSLVQDIAGGIIPVMWRRLEPWLTELRVEQGNPSDSEWFQWLAEQLDRRKTEKQPAYLRHKDWQP
jgi:hypothetical protein